MKENIIHFVKGFVIGFGKIMPGVSGAALAISLNVYDKIIYFISHIRKITPDDIPFMFSLCLGFVVSISIFSKTILFLTNNFYAYIMSIFLGILVGNIFNLIMEQRKNINIKNIMIFLVSFLLITSFFFINIFNINFSINFISLVFLGLLESFTMIIPGISGSALLMMFGVYELIIHSFTTLDSLNILIPFVIGILFGIILLSKFLNHILNKYNKNYYFAIIGFMMATIFILMNNISKYLYDCNHIMIVILSFIFAVYIGFKIK